MKNGCAEIPNNHSAWHESRKNPGNRPYLKDVVVAKNYLNEKELRSLGQLVSGYLEFALKLAESFFGKKKADDMAAEMLLK